MMAGSGGASSRAERLAGSSVVRAIINIVPEPRQEVLNPPAEVGERLMMMAPHRRR